MKKIVSLIICAVMLLGIVSCGSEPASYLSLPAKGHEMDISLDEAMKVYCEFTLKSAEENKIEGAECTYEWAEGWEGKNAPEKTLKDGEEKVTLVVTSVSSDFTLVVTYYLAASENEGSIRAISGVSALTEGESVNETELDAAAAAAKLDAAYSFYKD